MVGGLTSYQNYVKRQLQKRSPKLSLSELELKILESNTLSSENFRQKKPILYGKLCKLGLKSKYFPNASKPERVRKILRSDSPVFSDGLGYELHILEIIKEKVSCSKQELKDIFQMKHPKMLGSRLKDARWRLIKHNEILEENDILSLTEKGKLRLISSIKNR